MNAGGYAVIVVLVVAALGAYAVFPIGSVTTPGTVSSSYTTTQSTSCSTKTSAQINSTTIDGNFTVSGSGVRVDYVRAIISVDQLGPPTMRIQVGFTNNGSSGIYIPVGCGSSLNSTIISGGGVIRTVEGGARCLCPEALSPVLPGQVTSELEPGCWSGYHYQVLGSGTFTARLVLGWYPSSTFGQQSYVVIDATFMIP